MAFYARYTLLSRPPPRLRFRNGTVLLELVRDVSTMPPLWVFRARRTPSAACLPALAAPGLRTGRPLANPLPSISPAALAAASEHASVAGSIVIASSLYGRHHLEQDLRDGVVLAEDSAEARIMEALVRLGYAGRSRATRRDL